MKDKNITVATFPNILDAKIFQNRLTLEGIESYLIDANMFLYYVSGDTVGGVRLVVKESDAEKAKRIIEEARA